jgi:predicted ATPase
MAVTAMDISESRGQKAVQMIQVADISGNFAASKGAIIAAPDLLRRRRCCFCGGTARDFCRASLSAASFYFPQNNYSVRTS